MTPRAFIKESSEEKEGKEYALLLKRSPPLLAEKAICETAPSLIDPPTCSHVRGQWQRDSPVPGGLSFQHQYQETFQREQYKFKPFYIRFSKTC